MTAGGSFRAGFHEKSRKSHYLTGRYIRVGFSVIHKSPESPTKSPFVFQSISISSLPITTTQNTSSSTSYQDYRPTMDRFTRVPSYLYSRRGMGRGSRPARMIVHNYYLRNPRSELLPLRERVRISEVVKEFRTQKRQEFYAKPWYTRLLIYLTVPPSLRCK